MANSKEVKCPKCAKLVPAYPDDQGARGWLRIMAHAGPRWGRPCHGGGELASNEEQAEWEASRDG